MLQRHILNLKNEKHATCYEWNLITSKTRIRTLPRNPSSPELGRIEPCHVLRLDPVTCEIMKNSNMPRAINGTLRCYVMNFEQWNHATCWPVENGTLLMSSPTKNMAWEREGIQASPQTHEKSLTTDLERSLGYGAWAPSSLRSRVMASSPEEVNQFITQLWVIKSYFVNLYLEKLKVIKILSLRSMLVRII